MDRTRQLGALVVLTILLAVALWRVW